MLAALLEGRGSLLDVWYFFRNIRHPGKDQKQSTRCTIICTSNILTKLQILTSIMNTMMPTLSRLRRILHEKPMPLFENDLPRFAPGSLAWGDPTKDS